MIEKMYKAYVVSKLEDKRQMVSDLRDLGLMHIKFENSGAVSSPELDRLKTRLASLQRIRMVLEERVPKKTVVAQKSLTAEEFEQEEVKITSAIDGIKAISEEIGKLKLKLGEISVWGDYSSSDYQFVSSCGQELHFYTMGKKDLAKVGDEVNYILLKPVLGQCVVATVGGRLPKALNANEFVIDSSCPSSVREMIETENRKLDDSNSILNTSTCFIDAFKKEIHYVSEQIKFEMAREAVNSEGGSLCWIVGFIPESGLDAFRKSSTGNGYAYLIEDVREEDNPPTKVIYNKVTALMDPLFKILGTVPGYYEFDISMWFLMFFALFFAMIIGDAAYGLIFVAIAVVLHIKSRKATNMVLLVYVVGIATVIWGALTGTWFGSEAILANSRLLKALVIPQISNYPELFGIGEKSSQDTVMKFCFIIGTLQLSLACVMNIIRKIGAKDLSAVADVGWLLMIDSLYFLVLMLVLNETVNMMAIVLAVACGFVLVTCFSCQGPGVKFGKGLASGAGGLFTNFLNTISAFGNIMSYIRLFAVGMASLAIAQSFNDMAAGMLSGFALPAGILILVIGHGLNLIMGLLSVIVHGVRLNLLEFSGQLGMAWTGIAYEPFCKSIESK